MSVDKLSMLSTAIPLFHQFPKSLSFAKLIVFFRENKKVHPILPRAAKNCYARIPKPTTPENPYAHLTNSCLLNFCEKSFIHPPRSKGTCRARADGRFRGLQCGANADSESMSSCHLPRRRRGP